VRDPRRLELSLGEAEYLGMSIWKNKYLLLTEIIALLATASLCYVPAFQAVFRLVPLTLYDWLWTGSVGSLGLLVLPEVFYGRKIWRWK
jgi:hypothetical protein